MSSSHQVLDHEPDHHSSQHHAPLPPHGADVEKLMTEEQVQPKGSVYAGLGWLDRLLVLWILLAIIVGILLGNFANDIGPALQKGKFVDVSIPIGLTTTAVGLLVMMYPILCKFKYETLHRVFAHRQVWIQLGFSIVANWIIAPLLMLGLAWAFLPDEPGLRTGLIFVGLARCIAMMVLYAPLAILFVNVISRGGASEVSYSTVARSVGVFLGIPLGAAIATRFILRAINANWYEKKFLKWIAPWSLLGLLYTILVLFASQGKRVVHQIVSVVRVAAPLIVYFVIIFFLTLMITKRLGFGYKLATTQSFTAASNNFELAIAVAVATFGANSDEALATTVGPLIEVPVLISLVYLVRWIAGRWNWKD
ncbi:arsenicals resistance [Elasticomyces elasticus]|uniref:Arsenicals resistance n=1 Tax=Exophiala sideris TaxID=1016849 RepID=A0ABR0IUT4_9EURO|nr:arsenicals resistance [Elasticomyces elasticus]KAK5020904.1 arsenicals resistance [Exophiala sideris]KAK5023107.1 arsenicals resistance [Exophiala sideris]KAK5048422.1 arsenicals resistance [Exophiala sideris]KAK5176068.1 arsenicals resistance [Eurotiomycetes sp. CCFEE 6388]